MSEKGQEFQNNQLVQIKAAADILSLKRTVKITAMQSLVAMKTHGGTVGSKGLAEAAMTTLATQQAGSVAASTGVAGKARLPKNTADATLVMAVVVLQPALLAVARNRVTAGVPVDMAGDSTDVAIGVSSAVVAKDASNLAKLEKNKTRAVRKVEEGGGGAIGRLIGGLAIVAASEKTRGVLGNTVRRGIAMATKRGVKTAARGMGEVRTFLPAARAAMGAMIVTEGMLFSTGDLRHQHWRICRCWTISARLQGIQHSIVRHRCLVRRTILMLLPPSTPTRLTAILNSMDRRQVPNKPLQRQLQQNLHHKPCLQPWPQCPKLLF